MDEPFGDHLLLECGPEWLDECEQDWNANADDESLAMGYIRNTSNWGVGMLGADDDFYNVTGRHVVLDSSVEGVELRVRVHGLDGEGTFAARLHFRNSSGNIIKTVDHVEGIEEEDSATWVVSSPKPPNAVSVSTRLGLEGLGALVWVDWVTMESASDLKVPAADEIECETDLANEQESLQDLRCQAEFGSGASFTGMCTGVYQSGTCFLECFGGCYPSGPYSGFPEVIFPPGGWPGL